MAAKFSDESKSTVRFSDMASEPRRMLPPIKGFEEMPLVSLEEAVEPLVSLVPDVQHMVWTVKQNCDQPEDALSSDESASIMLYSMEWTPKEASFYLVFNTTLRSENREKLKPWFLYLRLIVTSLSKLPSTRLTVYRGVKTDLSSQYPKGKTFVWWGFSSCTASIGVLDYFLGKTGTRTFFAIDCDTGKDIHKHSLLPDENEVLLLAARHFKVVDCLDQGNGLHMIQLKEIQPPFPLLPSVSLTASPSIPSPPPQLPLTSPSNYRNPTLEKLIDRCEPRSEVNLYKQNLTDRDMEIVAQQVIINKQCTLLQLGFNQITPEGVSIIAKALHNNTTIGRLYLDGNCVSDEGVKSLAQTLSRNNSTLRTLDLQSNGITDQGVQYLAEMLETNTTLVSLLLSSNEIGNRGVHLLTNALIHHNNSLQRLFLDGNKLVSDSSVDSLIDMLKRNRSLTYLNMRDCHLSEKGKTRLREVAKSKKDFELMM